MREFVHDPRLAQRKRAVQEVLVENAKLTGIEAVEAANRRDLLVKIRQ